MRVPVVAAAAQNMGGGLPVPAAAACAVGV